MPITAGGGWRCANEQDVPALAALYALCATTQGPLAYTPEQVAAWQSFAADLAGFRAYVLEAQTWMVPPDAQGAVGFCGVDSQGEVRSLYVRPDRARQGLGSALLAHAIAQARQRGLRRFAAWATPFSQPVFQRAGFVLLHICREPYQGVLFDRARLQRSDSY
jgi:putative acetyltransferase